MKRQGAAELAVFRQEKPAGEGNRGQAERVTSWPKGKNALRETVLGGQLALRFKEEKGVAVPQQKGVKSSPKIA